MHVHGEIPREVSQWSIESIEAAALIGFDADVPAGTPVAGMKRMAHIAILAGALR
jgi:hypothetical protein